MNILLLGASGLIGHRIFIELGARSHDVHGLMLGPVERFSTTGLFNEKNATGGIDLAEFDQLLPVLADRKPEVIINCCGITRRRPEVNNAVRAISVNAILPHKLADWAGEAGARVVHLSTDCVFDGKLGNYDEDAPISGEDQYGRTKGLGELWYDHTVTLRTSFIGQELQHHSELLDWFLGQRGKTIRGFTRAMYSGFSTIQCARMIVDIIENNPDLSGLYNMSMAQPVSKFDLLSMANKAYGIGAEIIPEAEFSKDASLDGSKLRNLIGLKSPSWETMMQELADDRALYGRP